jgi:hypothetical protein
VIQKSMICVLRMICEAFVKGAGKTAKSVATEIIILHARVVGQTLGEAGQYCERDLYCSRMDYCIGLLFAQ